MPPIVLRNFLWLGLRQPFSLPGASSFRHASHWATSPRFSSQFFTRTAVPSPLFSKKLLWVITVSGGVILLATPARREPRNVFASSDLIPCAETAETEALDPVIMSPSESDRTLLGRFVLYLHERILEPLLTAKRFVYLCFVFIPVFLTAPMLLIGQPESKLGGDRWGAVWWYGFLTRQMQRAGPTFIKVGPSDTICP